MPYRPGADAAGRDLAELHVEHRDHAAEAGVGVVERVDRAGGGQRRRVGEHRRVGDAEALFDTFHRRADRGGDGAVVPAAGTSIIRLTLISGDDAHRPRRSRSPASCCSTMRPKVRGSEKAITSSRKISTQFVHVVGFSNGCAELALKKPPPLVPSSLMTSWLATGPPVMVCCPPASVLTTWSCRCEVLDGAAGDQDDRGDDRDAAAGCGWCRGPGRPRSCRARRCCAGRGRERTPSRRPCRPRRRRSSARPGRPSAPGGPGWTHPSRPASWCSSRS